MPITLSFNFDMNISVQPGDMLYASSLVGGQGGSNHLGAGGTNTKPKKLGIINVVNHAANTLQYTAVPGAPNLNNSSFIMFCKNKLVNYSGITGYYAETEYRNYSTLPAEIFATAVDYVVSSK